MAKKTKVIQDCVEPCFILKTGEISKWKQPKRLARTHALSKLWPLIYARESTFQKCKMI